LALEEVQWQAIYSGQFTADDWTQSIQGLWRQISL